MHQAMDQLLEDVHHVLEWLMVLPIQRYAYLVVSVARSGLRRKSRNSSQKFLMEEAEEL